MGTVNSHVTAKLCAYFNESGSIGNFTLQQRGVSLGRRLQLCRFPLESLPVISLNGAPARRLIAELGKW